MNAHVLAAALVTACSGKSDDSATSYPPPTLSWLSPTDGATLSAGTQACSVVVDAFVLQDLAKHSEGAPTGYLAITADDAVLLQTAATTFDLALDVGSGTLGAKLFYADGDEVMATADRLCEEDDADTACAPVAASIHVTVE